MKLYLIAGEASGDLHGSNLLKALYQQQPDLVCRAWGGDRMAAAGAEVVKHYRDLAFMGFWEVAKNLRTILRNLAFCKADIEQFQPDALVLIDYPGFNLRIARWAKQRGYKVIYYISPQIWAWKQGRVHDIRRDVDAMLVILPFERDFYAKFGMEVHYVGHPLLDEIAPRIVSNESLPTRPLVAILPGSRRQEVQRILPRFLSVVPHFPDCDFVVAGVSNLPVEVYQSLLQHHPRVSLQTGDTYGLLRRATAALVKSGTSTLETALHRVPQVVGYAGSPISYAIAKRLVKVPYISLVNLIANAPVVEELIQDDLNTERLVASLRGLLVAENRQLLLAKYAALSHLLGDQGASARAAQHIVREIVKGDV